jgi:hypothetical protein
MLTILVTVAVGQIPMEPDFAYQRRGFSELGAEALNGFAIIRPLRKLNDESRIATSFEGGQRVTVSIEEVAIVASAPVLPNTVRIVVPHSNFVTTIAPLDPSADHMIVFHSSAGTNLKLPLWHFVDRKRDPFPEEQRYLTLERRDPNEILGLAEFKTNSTRIDGAGQEPMSKLLRNVANCLAGTGDENVARVCRFIEFARFERPEVPADAPFVIAARAAARTQSASNRARIYAILAHYNVPGSFGPFYEALKEAAPLDVNLFALLGEGIRVNRGSFIGAVIAGALTVDERRRKNEEYCDLTLAARSRTVKWFLIQSCSRPDLERQRRFLALAESADEDLARLTFDTIARWHKDTVHVPVRVLEGSTLRWVNRQELIDYWSSRLEGE